MEDRNEDLSEPLHLDVEFDQVSDEHDDHLVTVNISLMRGGVHKTNVYCATCQRMLRFSEARANAVVK